MRKALLTKIVDVFPGQNQRQVLAKLDSYDGPEPDRVRLAVLKLSQEAGYDSPDVYLEIAKTDYRDVLAWAEYPRQAKRNWSSLSPRKKQTIRLADRAQYERWLGELDP